MPSSSFNLRGLAEEGKRREKEIVKEGWRFTIANLLSAAFACSLFQPREIPAPRVPVQKIGATGNLSQSDCEDSLNLAARESRDAGRDCMPCVVSPYPRNCMGSDVMGTFCRVYESLTPCLAAPIFKAHTIKLNLSKQE